MKIILMKDIPKLGKRWDIKDVSDGYARNVLLPKELAMPATKINLEKATREQEKRTNLAEKSLQKAQELASSLDGYELTIPVRTNEHGDLYAAINAKQVIEAFAKEGFAIHLKMIRIDEQIKRVGEYPITISLDHGLEIQTKLIVEEQKDPDNS